MVRLDSHSGLVRETRVQVDWYSGQSVPISRCKREDLAMQDSLPTERHRLVAQFIALGSRKSNVASLRDIYLFQSSATVLYCFHLLIIYRYSFLHSGTLKGMMVFRFGV